MTIADLQLHCPACDTQWREHVVEHLGFRLNTCDECGLWFWPQRDTPDYDSVYGTAEYQEAQVDPFINHRDTESFRQHPTYLPFFRQIPKRPGALLLDIGCGVGRFLVAARDEGWKTKGIDVSKRAVEIGRNGAGLDLSCDTPADLQTRGERFDAVTAFEVLEHLPEPIQVVKEALALMLPGGHFLCTVPNRLSPTVLTTSRPDWLPPIHLQFFTPLALQKLLVRAGGKNVRTGLITGSDSPRIASRMKQLLKRHVFQRHPDPVGLWGIAQH